MRTALRSSRVRKWLAFLLFLVMLVGWVVSFEYSIRYQNPTGDLVGVIDGGGLLIAWYSPPRWDARHVGWQLGLAVERSEGRSWFFPRMTHPRPGATWLFIPLSPLILVVVGLMCWWFWKDRPPAPDHCRFCGYDMKGNISGVCPECGTRRDSASTTADVAAAPTPPRNEEGDGTR